MIDLYTAATPSSHPVSILREELRTPYTTHLVDLSKEEHRHPEYTSFQSQHIQPLQAVYLLQEELRRLYAPLDHVLTGATPAGDLPLNKAGSHPSTLWHESCKYAPHSDVHK